MENLFLVCRCSSDEHIVRFMLFDDPKDKELFVTVHLSTHKGFFGRLWAGIKHAFGHRCKYGDWDEIQLTVEDAKKLSGMLDRYIGDE